MNNMRTLITSVAVLGCLVLAGCGKSEQPAANQKAPGSGSQPAGASTAASGRQIEITGNDQMKFSMNEIRAKPGESITVTLSNIGTMPKVSMGHNWILLKPTTDLNTFVTEAASAPTTDYIPASRQADVIAHTKLLGPKEKDSVTFQAPSEPGRYPFICSFPGHFQIGMRGELIVE